MTSGKMAGGEADDGRRIVRAESFVPVNQNEGETGDRDGRN